MGVRIRTIKPETWDSEKLGSKTALARLTFIGLISIADDDGRGRGEANWLRGRLHGYAADVTAEAFLAALQELAVSGLVTFYEKDGSHYYALPGWLDHQKIEKPRPSLLPHPPRRVADSSTTPPRQVVVGLDVTGREGKGMDPTGRDPGPVDSSRDQQRLLSLLWKVTGDHYGKRVQDLPGDYAEWALNGGLTQIGPEYKAALKVRLSQKNGERGDPKARGGGFKTGAELAHEATERLGLGGAS